MSGILVGKFKLTCVGSGNVLDVSQGITTDGVRLITFPPNGDKNQQWIGKASAPQGGLVLGGTLATALNTGSAPKVVDSSLTVSNEVVLWPSNGQKNQMWMFVPVQGTRYYVIRNVANGRCMRGSGVYVTLAPEDHKDTYQRWTYTSA